MAAIDEAETRRVIEQAAKRSGPGSSKPQLALTQG